MTPQSRGRNVLVTGGASGLGEGIATSYAKAGAHVVIADRNEELGLAVEQQLVDAGYKAKYIYVDVVSTKSQASMLQQALAWLPENEALDAVVLCAGINGNPFDLTPEAPSALSDASRIQPIERSAATMQVNLVSVVLLVQLATKYAMGLEKQGQDAALGPKSITLMASLASYRGLPRAVDYTASKWGLRGAFKSLRQQLPKVGIRINLVAPAFIKTPLLAETIPMYESIGVKFANKEDVVGAVHKVVDDESVNGRAYAVSSEGFADLDDDAKGKDAFDAVTGLVNREALGTADCPIGHDGTR